MSKAVLLKDLYLEIEKMKQGLIITTSYDCFVQQKIKLIVILLNINADVRAAREKNGVYIPHERFAREEAEKKVDIQFLYIFNWKKCLVKIPTSILWKLGFSTDYVLCNIILFNNYFRWYNSAWSSKPQLAANKVLSITWIAQYRTRPLPTFKIQWDLKPVLATIFFSPMPFDLFETLQVKNEKIEQLENDLNLSEKVWFACSLVDFNVLLWSTARFVHGLLFTAASG